MSLRMTLWLGFVAALIGVMGCDDSPTGPDTEIAEAPFRIEIDCVDDVIPGSEVDVKVRLTRAVYPVSSMGLCVMYDTSKLSLLQVAIGEDLIDIGWRGYFTSRWDVEPPYKTISATLSAWQMIGDEYKPSNLLSNSADPVMSLLFYVSGDNCECGDQLPVRFGWPVCPSSYLNYYRSLDPDHGLSAVVHNVYDPGSDVPLHSSGGESAVYCGGSDTCDEYYQSMPTPPRPMIDFVHGSVNIIDYRGDLNLNGRVEVADGVLFSNYFANGETIDYVDSVQQAWMSDVNEDGEPFTSADAVCLIKHLATGEDIPDEMEPIYVNCTISDGVLSCDKSLSLVFCRWEGTEDMEILHPDFHGSHSTDGVSSWASIQTQNFVESEPGPLLRLNADYIKVDVADSSGAPVILTLTNNDGAPRQILTAVK